MFFIIFHQANACASMSLLVEIHNNWQTLDSPIRFVVKKMSIKFISSIFQSFRTLLPSPLPPPPYVADWIVLFSDWIVLIPFAIWIIILLWYLNGTRVQTNILNVHQSLLQTPLLQPVSTPLFLQGFTPTCSDASAHCSQFRLAYETKDANILDPHLH